MRFFAVRNVLWDAGRFYPEQEQLAIEASDIILKHLPDDRRIQLLSSRSDRAMETAKVLERVLAVAPVHAKWLDETESFRSFMFGFEILDKDATTVMVTHLGLISEMLFAFAKNAEGQSAMPDDIRLGDVLIIDSGKGTFEHFSPLEASRRTS